MSVERFQFPPYTYVPGGSAPHPKSSPLGHSAGVEQPDVILHSPEGFPDCQAFRDGAVLFNAGYYWEAHEAWEAVWKALGRRGPFAELVKGWIKLAAAGVKVREGKPNGASTHAKRAEECYRRAGTLLGASYERFDTNAWVSLADRISQNVPRDPGGTDGNTYPVFDFEIDPSTARPHAVHRPVVSLT